MPVLKIKKDGVWDKVSNINMLSVGGSGSDLPNAEEHIFGIDDSLYRYGITSHGSFSMSADSNVKTYGTQFYAKEAIAILGFRVFSRYNEENIRLWDNSEELVRKVSVSGTAKQWNEVWLDEPFNVSAGENFMIAARFTDSPYYLSTTGVVFDSKIEYLGQFYTTSSDDTYPSEKYNGTFYKDYVTGVVDIIIGQVSEGLPSEYKIKRVSMDDIAEEAQRIVGQETKMSVAQIKAGLQGVILQEKTVTPTDTEQEITPDEGYYGLSRVMVGASGNTGITLVGVAVGIIPEYSISITESSLILGGLLTSNAVGILQE